VHIGCLAVILFRLYGRFSSFDYSFSCHSSEGFAQSCIPFLPKVTHFKVYLLKSITLRNDPSLRYSFWSSWTHGPPKRLYLHTIQWHPKDRLTITKNLSFKYAKHSNDDITFQVSSSLQNRISCTVSLERYGTVSLPCPPHPELRWPLVIGPLVSKHLCILQFSNLVLFNSEDVGSILFNVGTYPFTIILSLYVLSVI
jgi:hypothetical protein